MASFNFNMREADWSIVSGRSFDVTADASISDNIVTVTVTCKAVGRSSGYMIESPGVLAKCIIDGTTVSHPTIYYPLLSDEQKAALSGYTNIIGNGVTSSNYVAHISPTPTDSYNGGNNYIEFWYDTVYTTTFTRTVSKQEAARNISWSVNFVPSQDGANKHSLTDETWKATGTLIVPALPKYTVSAAANPAGSVTVSGTGIKTHGNSVTLTATAATGYTFSSWTYGGNTYIDNPWKITTSITGNISVTANATANKYTVTYDANGGTCSTTSKDVTYNSTYGTLATPTKTGYTFSGWYTAASGGNQVTASTKVTITSNQTLYAHWTANTYTLTFNANGGTNTSGGNFALTTPATGYGATESWVTVTYDSSNFSAMSGNNPTRTGYKFLGWYTATSGGTQIYDANGGSTDNGTYWSTSGTWNSASNRTVYAQWEALATMFVKVDGSYKAGIPYVKVNGDWKRATAVYVKVNGDWKLSTR